MVVTPHGTRERRVGPDRWATSLNWFTVIGWTLLMLAMFLVAYAKPEVETFFERANNLQVRTTWDLELAWIIYLLLRIGLFASIVGLIINFRRKRRRGDEVRNALVVMAMASLLGIILYQITF